MPNLKNTRNISRKFGIHSLDFLGQKFSLTYDSLNGKLQTSFGGSLTIFLALSTTLVSVVVFSQLFNTQTPVVTTSLEYGSKFAKFDFFEEELIKPFRVMSKGTTFKNISRYVTLKTAIFFNMQNATTGEITKGINKLFDFVPCNQIKDTKVTNLLKKLGIGAEELSSLTFCPDFGALSEEYYAQIDTINFDTKSVKVYIFPCSLPSQRECAPERDLNTAVISFTSLKKYFVSSDKKNPLREIAEKKTIRVDKYNNKIRNYGLQVNRLIDDSSMFASPRVVEEFSSSELEFVDTSPRNGHTTYCSPKVLESSRPFRCSPYVVFSFDPTGKSLVMNRSYKGALSVMGEFGGVVKIITAVVFFIYSIYSAKKLKSYFSSRIFKLNKKQLKRLEEILGRDKESSDENNQKVRTQGFGQRKDEMRKMMEECVESKFNAADMMYKLSMLEVLEDVLFEEHDKTLLPLVIMNRYKNKLKQQKGQKRSAKNKKIHPKRTPETAKPSSALPPRASSQAQGDRGENDPFQKSNLHRNPKNKKFSLFMKKRPFSKKSLKNLPNTKQEKSQRCSLTVQPKQGQLDPKLPNGNIEHHLVERNSSGQALKIFGDEEINNKFKIQSLEEEGLSRQDSSDQGEDSDSPFEKAYNDLVSSSPKTEIKLAIKKYMIQNLSSLFKNPQKSTKNKHSGRQSQQKLDDLERAGESSQSVQKLPKKSQVRSESRIQRENLDFESEEENDEQNKSISLVYEIPEEEVDNQLQKEGKGPSSLKQLRSERRIAESTQRSLIASKIEPSGLDSSFSTANSIKIDKKFRTADSLGMMARGGSFKLKLPNQRKSKFVGVNQGSRFSKTSLQSKFSTLPRSITAGQNPDSRGGTPPSQAD